MIEDSILKPVLGAIIVALVGAVFNLFTRMRAVETANATLAAGAAQSTTETAQLGRRMEHLAEQMIDLGREMSGVAATLSMITRQNEQSNRNQPK